MLPHASIAGVSMYSKFKGSNVDVDFSITSLLQVNNNEIDVVAHVVMNTGKQGGKVDIVDTFKPGFVLVLYLFVFGFFEAPPVSTSCNIHQDTFNF
jgi:hypothetical protein